MARFAGSLDANVLLRLILNDIEPQHREVVELFEACRGQFAVADTAVIETVFVLERHYELTRLQIVDTIEGLMSLSQINTNRNLFRGALPLFAKNPALSFEDCCLVVYATLNDAEPLWTFDQKLAKQTDGAKLVAQD